MKGLFFWMCLLDAACLGVCLVVAVLFPLLFWVGVLGAALNALALGLNAYIAVMERRQ